MVQIKVSAEARLGQIVLAQVEMTAVLAVRTHGVIQIAMIRVADLMVSGVIHTTMTGDGMGMIVAVRVLTGQMGIRKDVAAGVVATAMMTAGVQVLIVTTMLLGTEAVGAAETIVDPDGIPIGGADAFKTMTRAQDVPPPIQAVRVAVGSGTKTLTTMVEDVRHPLAGRIDVAKTTAMVVTMVVVRAVVPTGLAGHVMAKIEIVDLVVGVLSTAIVIATIEEGPLIAEAAIVGTLVTVTLMTSASCATSPIGSKNDVDKQKTSRPSILRTSTRNRFRALSGPSCGDCQKTSLVR